MYEYDQTCDCSDEYGPCENHCELLVSREGASLRTADELAMVRVQDCVDCGAELSKPDARSQVRLDAALESCRDESSGCAWLSESDQDAAFTLADQVESGLPDRVRLYADDGYVIVRLTDDCPLDPVSADDHPVDGPVCSATDHAEEATYVQSVCIEDACEDPAPAAPAYSEVGSGTETTSSDARVCGCCERPLAPYAIDDRARYPYRAGDRCSCDSPQPIAIMEGSSVLSMITAHRAGTLSRPIVAGDLSWGYSIDDQTRAYLLRARTRSLVSRNVKAHATTAYVGGYPGHARVPGDTGMTHGPDRERLTRENLRPGERVIAHVTLDYPSGYAQGCDDPTAVAIDATVWCVEGDAGIAWTIVKLSDARDTDAFPNEYAHIPMDRLRRPSIEREHYGRVAHTHELIGPYATTAELESELIAAHAEALGEIDADYVGPCPVCGGSGIASAAEERAVDIAQGVERVGDDPPYCGGYCATCEASGQLPPHGEGLDESDGDPIEPDPEPIDGLTYTDDDGVERSAEEYVSRDRGDAPCSRYGTRHQDYAPWIIAHARILAESTGDLTSDSLDGCASSVVNDSIEPSYFVAAHGTDEERAQLLPELSEDSLDALRFYMLENGYEQSTISALVPGSWADTYDLDSFVEGFVTAALWSDCEHAQMYAVDVSHDDDDASDSGLSYDDAVAYVNGLADDLESDGWTCDRSWASADNLYAVNATREDAVRTVQVVRDEDQDSGGCEDLALDDESETIVRAYCARFVAANRPDLDAYGEQRSYDPSQGSVESYAGHDLYLTAVGHGTGFWDRGLGELGDRLTNACRAIEDVSGGLGMVDNGDGTVSLVMPSAYNAR